MKVLFFSRSTLKNILPLGDNSHIAVISVNDGAADRKKMRALLKDNVKHFHTQVFYDTCDSTSAFTREKARKIINFIDACHANPETKIIWVHCLMGISRSGAIAKFINTYLGLGIIELDDYTSHNMYVYETLCEVAGIPTLKQYYQALENNER